MLAGLGASMDDEAFFRAEGGAYFANPISAGPWRAQSLMGRCVTGLFGYEIERRHMTEGFVPARLTVELYDLADFTAITVETRLLRDGGRVRLVEADLICGGQARARATCQLLRHTEAPGGNVWSPPEWDAATPDQLQDEATRWKWHLRVAGGEMGTFGRKRVWLKDYRTLVAGVPLSPFVQAAMACDSVSPFTHGGDRGVEYINTEATMYLHRAPRDGWIGFDVADHQATDGLAIGQARLYDLHGPIGFASAAALAQRRPPGMTPGVGTSEK